MRLLIAILIGAVIIQGVKAQAPEKNAVQPTHSAKRWEGFEKRKTAGSRSQVTNLSFRSAGPSVMSGRVTDIDVSPTDPAYFYVAYASGGLWVTRNNGQSFEPLFDSEAAMTIGDIAVDWYHDEVIWLGTGENNSSRSSYSGTGIYKSADRGKSWQHAGLDESHHIGRIVLHPDSPGVAWVAAMGHLFSPNPERGIYKTSDGGKTWRHTLFIDQYTGAIDLALNPANPAILYASMWHRQRRAWNFTESGVTSGIYKSSDGGITWNACTPGNNGFPSGQGVGRIGLAVYPANPDVVYAVLDNQDRRPPESEPDTVFKLTKDTLRTMPIASFLELGDTVLATFLEESGFDKEYTAVRIKNMVLTDSIKPLALVEYLEDANSLLFDTEVIGAEVYRSDNGGRSWIKTNSGFLDHVYNTYGYYFGEIRVSPVNDKKIYIGGVPLLKSEDGGKTFTSIDADNMHGDFQAHWINPLRDGHMIIGNDGGLNITYDDGKTYFKANSPPVGQFYTVQVDYDTPYNIYGGLQDNGVWTGPSNYKAGNRWHATGHYPWKLLLWGDGMQIMVDGRDNNTVYAGFQFGFYYRINKSTGETVSIKPRHKLGERPLRFNWQTPIWLSEHNQDILYLGSNKFHRSMDKGNRFLTLSGDLTRGGKKGDVPYGTLTTIHESPLKFGLLYVGSDDGLVHVSHDAGYTWTRITNGLPRDFWVKRVTASMYDTATVYACFNGHAWDNFASLLYVSADYGRSWKRIGTDLPDEPLNVVREDPVNKNIIYAGTDHGLYVSLDKGKSFMLMNNGLPAVPVHDLVVHTRENELVVGTHGRSIFIARLDELQQLTDSVLARELYVFKPTTVNWSGHWGHQPAIWQEAREPEKAFSFYVRQPGFCRVEVKTESGLVLFQATDTSESGLNYMKWNLAIDSGAVDDFRKQAAGQEEKQNLKKADNGRYYLLPGKYSVEVESARGLRSKQEFVVKAKEQGAPAKH